MKVIVGLGNPTPKYANTRHNIGAMTVDRLCKQWGITLERRNRYVLLGQGRFEGNEVVLAKPRSFMNLERRAGGVPGRSLSGQAGGHAHCL